MTSQFNRRSFVQSVLATGAAATSAVSIVPRNVLGGVGYVPPSEKITLAHIGMGTQGFSELGGLLENEQIQIVAVCDPNKDSNDYVEWGKHGIRNRIRTLLGQPNWRQEDPGCPGGRDIGQQVVNAYYANHRSSDKYQGCASYADFRELLETEKDLDAVKVMTPDHLHATVCMAAMNKGKHAIVHKPLGNRLYEARRVVELARKTKLSTHLLAYGSGTGNGRIASYVKSGVIGTLKEIHNWTNRPVWPQYTEIPKETPPIPNGFEWDLWLGPAVDRPYHPHYTHTVFRGWYDFGGGSMADMGIYSLWPVFTALQLGVPVSAEAWATHTCAIVDNVSRPVRNDFSYPTACALRFRFAPARLPALDLFWYDGGMKPRLPDELEAAGVEMAREGILFVCDHGAIMAGFNGQSPQLFVKGKRRPLWDGDAAVSRSRRGDYGPGGRYGAWIESVRGGEPSPGSFQFADAISDAVNLGTVALRAGRRVEFDSDNMQITNIPAANKFLRREYRPGWEL